MSGDDSGLRTLPRCSSMQARARRRIPRRRAMTVNRADLQLLRSGASVLEVALLIPLHGSAGIYGPSCELCAETGGRGGQRGRRRARPAAAAARGRRVGPPPAVAAARSARWSTRARSTRWSAGTSPRCGTAVAPRIARPRARTSTPRCTRAASARPACSSSARRRRASCCRRCSWLRRGARRAALVHRRQRLRVAARHGRGRAALRAAVRRARSATRCSSRSARRRSTTSCGASSAQRADAVLMLLVGQDAVEFNRAFAARRACTTAAAG